MHKKSLKDKILLVRPDAASIVSIESYRPDYLFFPARIQLQLENGQKEICVIKANKFKDSILFEAKILKALKEIGLSVQEIRSEVFRFTHDETEFTGLLLSEIEGESLPWLGLNDLQIADFTCQLTILAIERLHSFTSKVLSHPVSAIIPRKTLNAELEMIATNAGDWMKDPIYGEAFKIVEKIIPKIDTPLVFSNGDYNPLNFIVKDNCLVGFIDFEHACFEDPYIGFAKFLLFADDDFGWGAGRKSGLVEKFLFKHLIIPSEFYSRLILRGLFYIQHESVNSPPGYLLRVVEYHTKKIKCHIDYE